MIKEALHKVINNEDLTYEEALETMKEIMTGEASQIQMAAFLTALRMKGETITEITACAKGMRAVGTHLQPKKEALEIVGYRCVNVLPLPGCPRVNTCIRCLIFRCSCRWFPL